MRNIAFLLVLICAGCGQSFFSGKSMRTRTGSDSPGRSTEVTNELEEVTNSIGMRLVLIPSGSFMMGAPPSEPGFKDDERQHQVTLTKPYFLGIHEVTQGQFERVMGYNPSQFQGELSLGTNPSKRNRADGVDTSSYPVEWITWDEAVEFCKKLSELPEEKKAGRVYRLPTEAESEYACRAGSQSAYCFGEDAEQLKEYAWYSDNSGDTAIDGNKVFRESENGGLRLLHLNCRPHPVGQKRPNAWGLYDMHGNVWEWCSDWYGDFSSQPQIDPQGLSKSDGRSVRWGGFTDPDRYIGSARRYKQPPSYRGLSLGFRVAMNHPSQ